MICESLESNGDIVLKWKRDHLEVIELKKKTVRSKIEESKFTSGAAGSEELIRILPGAGLLLSSQPVDNNRIPR